MENLYFKIGKIIRRIKNKKLKSVAVLIKEKLKTPSNIISIVGASAGVASAFFIFRDHKLFVAFLLTAYMMDIMDGAVARFEGKKENGWMIDSVCDRIVTTSLLIAFLNKYNFEPKYVVLFLVYVTINIYVLYVRRLIKGKRVANIEIVAYILFFLKNFKTGILIIGISAVVGLINAIYFKKTFLKKEQR